MEPEPLEIRYHSLARLWVILVSTVSWGGLAGVSLLALFRDPTGSVGTIRLQSYWFCLLPFTLFFAAGFVHELLRVPYLLSDIPVAILDREGITHNYPFRALTIPWRDVAELSFPLRSVYRLTTPFLDIRLKEAPRQTLRRSYLNEPFLAQLTRLARKKVGDYEISLWGLGPQVWPIRTYLEQLREAGCISFQTDSEGTIVFN